MVATAITIILHNRCRSAVYNLDIVTVALLNVNGVNLLLARRIYYIPSP